MRGGFDGAEGKRFIRYLIVPRRLVVRMKKEMGMSFDQAGNQGVVRQINCVRVARRLPLPYGTGFDDPLALHERDPILMQLHAIEDSGNWQEIVDRSRRLTADARSTRNRRTEPRDRQCFAGGA